MTAIRRFEDIVAWQGARALVREVYQATDGAAFERDYGLRNQIQRAAVSAMSNIAEGYERDSDREFRHFLSIAKASAGEVRSLLYVALNRAYIDHATHERLTEQATRLSRQIAKFMRYLVKES